MRTTAFVFAFVFVGVQALAANLAIIDSGVDYKHEALASKMWTNPNSKTVVDDGTEYENDLHGWNFADKNNEIIDYKYLGTFSPDCKKLFTIQGKILLGTATEEDKAWYQSKKNDKTFIEELEKFGNFVHGTHVSGIATKDADKAKVVALKLIATEPPKAPGGRYSSLIAKAKERDDDDGGMGGDALAKMFLGMIAQQQAKMLTTTGQYTKAVGADIANGSFGISVGSAKPIVAQLLKQLTGKDASEAEVLEDTKYLINQIIENSKEFVGAAPKTLFVFAAGNDGTDNDSLPASPANVKTDNTITVAATLGVTKLASFSNFGAKLVEVAAPGVVIKSSIPGNDYMELSGTSMAAPFVTGVAGVVKDGNPALTAAQIKKVLMGTVDVKSWLAGKVVTSGIVNRARAEKAAQLSTTMDLDAAIAKAKTDVPDVSEAKYGPAVSDRGLIVLPLPTTL